MTIPMPKVAVLYNDTGPVGDWGTLGQQPPEPTTQEHGAPYQDFGQKAPEGRPASPANLPQQLEAQGYWKCPGKFSNGQPCDFWLDPQRRYAIEHSNGYFTCPKCNHSFDLMSELPSHGISSDEFTPGGRTHIGLPLGDQGQIGENIVAGLGELPGYGP